MESDLVLNHKRKKFQCGNYQHELSNVYFAMLSQKPCLVCYKEFSYIHGHIHAPLTFLTINLQRPLQLHIVTTTVKEKGCSGIKNARFRLESRKGLGHQPSFLSLAAAAHLKKPTSHRHQALTASSIKAQTSACHHRCPRYYHQTGET